MMGIDHISGTSLMKLFGFLILMSVATLAWGELAPEQLGIVEKLPLNPSPHWVWVDDMTYGAMPDGRASLVDADSGKYLGLLSTGYSFNSLTIPSDNSEIYSAETYYSRHTRGKRTDVVSVYDIQTLSVKAEIEIPPKRASGIPTTYNAGISDDNRLVAVFNYTPAQSLSIVDVKKREYLGEVSIAGCALVYPAGPRKFASICGDGAVMTVELDNSGQETYRTRSKQFFDPDKDPVTEFAVRNGSVWSFVSFEGKLHSVDLGGKEPRYLSNWSLFTSDEREQGWRVGGQQHVATHEGKSLYYSLMSKGNVKVPNDAKGPSDQVWVYDIKKRTRIAKIRLKRLANSIQVTKDANPLLIAAFVAIPEVDIYDALTGEYKRTIKELGSTPTALQVY